MPTSIADLFVSVTSDVSGAISGLTQVDQRVNGASAAFSAAAPAGYALAAASTAIGAAFLASVGQAADFEHQINGIKAVMSPTEVQEFGGAVEDLALKLGKDTVFSSSQAASAIEEMIKAGVPLPAILSGAAKSALDLASATGTDVTKAADLASTAMNAFHESADALPHIMDTIANVSNATAISVDQLQLGLAAVGPVANGLGISFDDTATALGIFANNGLKGSDAGTSLKTMLLNLEPSTKAQKAAFDALGITTADGGNAFFDAEGKAKPLNEIFQILKDSTAGLTAEQKINLLQTAFGTDAVRAATIAANEGADGWDAVTAAMDKMGGTQVAAAQRNQGLEGSMNQLGGSFEAIQITIGKLFLPVLTQVVDGLTGLLNGFLDLDPGIQTIIVAVAGVAGAAAGLLAGFILLGPVISAVGGAFGVIAAAAAPVVLPILALAAAGAALYAAWQDDFGGIQEVTAQVWEAIQPAFRNIEDFITTLVNGLGPAFEGVQSAVAPFIAALSNDLAPILARLPDLVRLIGDGFNLLSGPARAIVSIVQILATGNYNGGIFGLDENSGVVQFFMRLHDAVALFFDAILRLLNGDFAGAWNSLWSSFTTVLQAAFTAEGQLLQTIGGAIVTFLQAIPGWIAENVPGMWRAFLDELSGLPAQLQPAWDAFAGWLGSVLGGIPQFVGDMAGDVWAALRAAFEGLVDSLDPAWDAFAGWLASVLGGVPQFVGDMAGDVWAALRAAFEGLAEQLAPAWDVFAGWFGSILGGIPQFVADMAGDIWASLRAAFEGLVDALAPAWDTFAGWFGSILGGLPQFIIDNAGDVFGGIVQQAIDLVGRIGQAIDPIRGLIAGTFGNIGNWVTGGTPGTGGGSGSPQPAPGGGGAGSVAITVNVYSGAITGAADEERLAQTIADAILASARRVIPPPPGVTPALG